MGKHNISTDKNQIRVYTSPYDLKHVHLYEVPALDIAQKFLSYYGFKNYSIRHFGLDF